MAGSKRKLEEVDVSEIEMKSEGITVHGVVTEVSPVKVSRNSSEVKYFKAKLTDGKKTVRVVAFDPALRGGLEKSQEHGTAVALVNWKVKETPVQFRDGEDKFEMVGSSQSRVEESPHKEFIVVRTDNEGGRGNVVVKIGDLDTVAVNQKVAVAVKVIRVKVPECIGTKYGKELVKQEYVIADGSGKVRMVRWESSTTKMVLDKYYMVTEVTVRKYKGAVYLSLSDEATVKEIEGFEVVCDEADEEEGPNGLGIEGEIVGIEAMDEYKSCVSCKAKVSQVSEVIGQCKKCGMKVKLSKCEVVSTAHVLFESAAGYKLKLTLFERELEMIKGWATGSGLEEKLLNLPRIKVCKNEKGIVYNVSLL